MLQGGNSRLQRQEQVKVVVRLKPEQSELKAGKCVYLSQQENHLVVQTDYKKEIFVFDHVAHQLATQADIYHMIGAEAVQASLEGYNCCIFAYGQTGAGKTYSIMGDLNELTQDLYCENRGLLPRLLEDLFNLAIEQQTTNYQITCSYLEIYNQQIYDLLSTDKRTHQIREDHRKGVFVEGTIETKLTSYRQAVDILLEGDKTRKIAYTSMNSESSRSHVIFTILIEAYTKEEGIIKTKKSKLNIVDLAGSERVKYTNVQGERLRQGCNINKSLHVLGNVINSLVQSTKKKKHIPYRDSKLTYYLKDSLGGNSITKLLANIHCSKQYYGDTLSTLMFAKRAKILKMKVQVNQNLTENFQSLRKEVRRLRQQLAEARYFKDNQRSQRTSFYQDFEQTLQKITDNSDYQVTPRIEIIQVFQENQLHYKSLIDIYEQHLKDCRNETSTTKRNSINKVGEWKNLQKRNTALTKLVQQFPAFTKIYKQNLLLKQCPKNNESMVAMAQDKKQSKKGQEQTTFMSIKQPQSTVQLDTSTLDQVIKVYETIIDEIKQKFTEQLQAFERSYTELEHQCKIKDKKIKELIKHQDLPPDIEELKNQNQYLHLNILNLQNEIRQLQENQNKANLEKRELKKNQGHRRSIHDKETQREEDQDLLGYVIDKMAEIKIQAEREIETLDKEREQMENIISQLNSQVTSLMNQNNKLQLKYKRSGSQRKSREKYQHFNLFESDTKRSMIDFGELKQSQYFGKSSTTTQVEFKDAQTNFTKELMTLRLEIKMKHKEVIDLKDQIEQFEQGDSRLEQQFGKNLDEIIKQYRELLKKQTHTSQIKSVRNINRFKEQDPLKNCFIGQDKNKKSSIEGKAFQNRQTPKKNHKEEGCSSNVASLTNSKNNFFSPK